MNRLRQWLSRRRPASLRSARLEMVVQHADAIDSSEARSFWARLLRGTAFLDASAEEQSEILRYAGQCYLRYYRDTDDARFLDEAVALLVSAVTCLPLPAPQTIAALNTCGLAYRARYAHHGDLADLDRACDQFRQAAEQEANRTTRSDYLANLAAARRSYYEHTGDPAILREALTVAEEALRLVPASSADRGSKLNLYANVLYATYLESGQPDSLARALQAWEHALTGLPERSSDWRRVSGNLGNGCRALYGRTGNEQLLMRAIACYEQAILPEERGVQAAGQWSNLGTAYHDLYLRTGEVAALMQAESAYRYSVNLAPPECPERADFLNNLGTGLCDRLKREAAPSLLDEAIDCFAEAVERASSAGSRRSLFLDNLGQVLRQRFTERGDEADIEAAIDAHREALVGLADDAPARAGLLNGLGNALLARYQAKPSMVDLEEAIDCYERALVPLRPTSPLYPLLQINLGRSLTSHAAATGSEVSTQRATKSFRRACQEGRLLSAEITLGSARLWVEAALARSAWTEAIEGGRYGVEALEALYQEQGLRHDKLSWLRAGADLHQQLAYAYVRQGELSLALEVVEQGRARLLREALVLDRAVLDGVPDRALVARFERAAAELRSIERVSSGERPTGATAQPLVPTDAAARREMAAAIEGIREVPGFADFLRPPRLSDIHAAVQQGRPLVYLTPTPHGTLLLVAGRTEDGSVAVTTAEAPLTTPELEAAVTRWQAAQEQRRHAPQAWRAEISRMTHWLWEVLMAPLLDALAQRRATEAVLIPGGLLALLPLHAACTEVEGVRHYALDHMLFSYAPSAVALLAARATANRIATDRLLAIEEPQPVMASPLPHTRLEVASVSAHFPDRQWLVGSEATRQATLDALPTATLFHAACHGTNEPTDPLRSGLILAHDERLSAQDFLALSLRGARLATLSACETGIIGTTVPDEVISFPTALLQANLAGVVASLWSVYDDSTALLLTRFYQLWRREGQPPPQALRLAQLWLRDASAAELRDFRVGALTGAVAARDLVIGSQEPIPATERGRYEHPVHWAAFYFTGV